MTQICSWPSYDFQQRYKNRWWFPKWLGNFTLFTLWHVDPCKRKGRSVRGDDSCGWFMRSGHGDPEVLAKIVSRFKFDWDRTFTSDDKRVYFCGLFCPNGDPHHSVQAIVLNLFFDAANVYFTVDGRSNWKKTRKWMQKNLFDILMFAENPTDSLFDGITRKFSDGAAESPRDREERIERMASCIYGWILREQRPWYRHPRWHINHWSIQIHPWQKIHRWLFARCAICKRGFKYGETPMGNWGGDKIWHQKCDAAQCPDPCSGSQLAQQAGVTPDKPWPRK